MPKEANMAVLSIVIVIVAALVIFSVQNANPVTLSFLVWQFSASLAIVVFLSLVSGVIVMALITAITRAKRSRNRVIADDVHCGDHNTKNRDVDGRSEHRDAL
jgi:uncharacterized integral membrane protein